MTNLLQLHLFLNCRKNLAHHPCGNRLSVYGKTVGQLIGWRSTEVGLGYLKWGQTLTTLSGGEGQRLKLAKELNRNAKGETLYILDEPSTGLHPNDVKKLLLLLNKLVDEGHTVIIVEHNTQIIKQADWVIDLGPEGGAGGGRVIAQGSPEEIKVSKKSYTGMYL